MSKMKTQLEPAPYPPRIQNLSDSIFQLILSSMLDLSELFQRAFRCVSSLATKVGNVEVVKGGRETSAGGSEVVSAEILAKVDT